MYLRKSKFLIPEIVFISFLLSFKVSSFYRQLTFLISLILLLARDSILSSVWLSRFYIFYILLFASESYSRDSLEKIVGTSVRLISSIDSTFSAVSIDKLGNFSTFDLPKKSLVNFGKLWTTDRSAIGFAWTMREFISRQFLISFKL